MPEPEPEPMPMPDPLADEWPDWPVVDVAAARPLVGSTQISMTPNEIGNHIESINRIIHEGGPSHERRCFDWQGSAGFLDHSACIGDEKLQGVMEHRGIPLVQTRLIYSRFQDPRSIGNYDEYSYQVYTAYGGLLEYGYFQVHATYEFAHLEQDDYIYFDMDNVDVVFVPAIPRSWYDEASSSDDYWPEPVATGHWEGVMVGIDENIVSTWNQHSDSEHVGYPDTVADPAYIVQGNADIYVHLNPGYMFDDRKVNVDLTNIVGINSGVQYPELNWRVWMGPGSASVSGFGGTLGRFTCFDNDCYLPDDSIISMIFAGPNHEEVIGSFSTPDMSGAFGAKRQ